MIISIITSLVIQIGYIINNDHCWLTVLSNKLINPEQPNRIWRADLFLQIKHYIRGDSWAYKDIYNFNQNNIVLFGNIVFIVFLIHFNPINHSHRLLINNYFIE